MFTLVLDEKGLQALSVIVDAALKGAGLAAHGPAGIVLQAMEAAVRGAHDAASEMERLRPVTPNGIGDGG